MYFNRSSSLNDDGVFIFLRGDACSAQQRERTHTGYEELL